MDRREVLRILATGSLLQLAPANLFAVLGEARRLIESQAALRTLNAHQYATVKTIAEMIIPRTDTPGAADVGVAEFIDLMLTEWYDEAELTRFLAGLRDVDSRSQARFAKDFVDCSPQEQSHTLGALGREMTEQIGENGPRMRGRGATPRNFYAMFRQLTLTAYYTSEVGATQELHFEIIPQPYEGCAAAPAPKGTEQP
jgi:hypothetical protein